MKYNVFLNILALLFSTTYTMDNYPSHVQLYNGIEKQNIKTIKQALKRGAKINKIDKNGETPLWHAIATDGNTEIVQLLIDHGADVNKSSQQSPNPLIGAIRNNLPDIITLLIKAGADVMHMDQTILHTPWQVIATRNVNMNILNLLFLKRDLSKEYICLFDVAYRNYDKMVNLYTLCGADTKQAIERCKNVMETTKKCAIDPQLCLSCPRIRANLKRLGYDALYAKEENALFLLKKAFITKQVLIKRAVAQATIDNVLNSVDPNKKDNDPTVVFICQLIQSCRDLKKLLTDRYALSVNSAEYTVTPCAIVSENPLQFDVIIKKK